MSNSISRKSLLAQIDKRWLGAGLAAAGAAAAADQATAAIVYHAPVGGINVPSSFAGVYVNVENEAFGASTTPGWDINPYGVTYLRLFTATGGAMKGPAAGRYNNLASGTPICLSDLDWRTGTTRNVGAGDAAGAAVGELPVVLNSSNNLFGFRFVGGDAITRVGWYRMSLGATPGGQPRPIVEWAFESDPQACIVAGVPEPGSLALLAAGAVGLVARRRRHS